MEGPDKPKWWSSVPGILTAATGFLVALTGLVTGLSQLGVFERRPAATPQEVASTPAPVTSTEPEEHTAVGNTSRVDSAAGPRVAATPGAAPSATTRPPQAAARDSVPVRTGARMAGDTATPPEASTSTAGPPTVVPAGTVLDLITSSRLCAPAQGMRRASAKTATAVRIAGAIALPRGTPAVLRVGRGASEDAIVVRVDSLRPPGSAIALPRSETRVRPRPTDRCLNSGTRLSVTLGSPLELPDT
jgi:hypothetical protein